MFLKVKRWNLLIQFKYDLESKLVLMNCLSKAVEEQDKCEKRNNTEMAAFWQEEIESTKQKIKNFQE